MTVYCEPVTAYRDFAGSLRFRQFVFAARGAIARRSGF